MQVQADGNGAVGSPGLSRGRLIRGDTADVQMTITIAPTPLSSEPFDPLTKDERPRPDYSELCEAARQEGYEAGHGEGYAAGVAEAEAQMAEAVQRLARLAERVLQDHAHFYRGAERQVLDLVMGVARKVVSREVEQVPDLVAHVVREALEEMDARTALRLRVNPEDFDLLERRWQAVVPTSVSSDKLELLQDARILPGGALIETRHGLVDAQLETKLAQVSTTLHAFSFGSEELLDGEAA